MEERTIAAIATASGNGSISIIRVSGVRAISAVDEIFFRPCADDAFSLHVLCDALSHTIHYGWIGESTEELIDEALVLIMRSPKSYTGEDVVEIQCHGGGLAARSILDLLLSHGVQQAEPGEFTKRAFLNGRIDLSQAESVMEVIRAKSDLALATAKDHLRGDVRDSVREMREILLQDMAYLEAALDDPEHIELTDYSERLIQHLDTVGDRIRHLITTAERGRRISEGIRTAIIGRPNVGKSSFLNCLLREERAIVTEIPGTTRDTLEEEVLLGGVLLRLIDTAGIRDTDDPVEKIGVRKAREAVEGSDLVIHVFDSSEVLQDEDMDLLSLSAGKPRVILLNKSDLATVVYENELRQMLTGLNPSERETTPCKIFEFSAKTGEGLSELESYLEEMFLCELADAGHEPVITSLRQKEALRRTLLSIDRIRETIGSGMPEDLLTVDLLDAYESLGLVTGDTYEDDLADKIFSEFCMGK